MIWCFHYPLFSSIIIIIIQMVYDSLLGNSSSLDLFSQSYIYTATNTFWFLLVCMIPFSLSYLLSGFGSKRKSSILISIRYCYPPRWNTVRMTHTHTHTHTCMPCTMVSYTYYYLDPWFPHWEGRKNKKTPIEYLKTCYHDVKCTCRITDWSFSGWHT